MENANDNGQEAEDTLNCMLTEQFKSILTTERQLREIIEEKESFKTKAEKLEQIPIRLVDKIYIKKHYYKLFTHNRANSVKGCTYSEKLGG